MFNLIINLEVMITPIMWLRRQHRKSEKGREKYTRLIKKKN